MLREVIEIDTTIRDKNAFSGLGMTKHKSGRVSVMMKTGMEVSQDYTVFNYGPSIPHKYVNHQERKKVPGLGVKTALRFVLPGNSNDKVGK